MASVSLKNVAKTYPGDKGRDVIAVKDLSLDIADREFVVLAGPAGCGKSSIVRLIAGLEEISQGDIFIGEKRVNDVAPKDRDIAMIFPDYALYPHLTVFDNLAFGLQLRKFSKAEIKKACRRRGEHSRNRIVARTQTENAFRSRAAISCDRASDCPPTEGVPLS